MARKLGCWLVVLLAGTSVYAANVGTISGTVKDASGAPQMGAVVEVYTSAATLGATVFTDDRGFYSADNLLPGTYQVKVTAVSFLPALRENVGLRAGARVLVNVTLTTVSDALQSLPSRRSARTQPDDWHWTLRSATNRPVLRVVDPNGNTSNAAAQPVAREKREDRSVKGSIAFIAGSEAEGFGSAGDMTTAFALEKSLFSSGTLTFDGNIGASAGDPAGILRASYSHDFGDVAQPTVTVTYRRFASPGVVVGSSPSAAMEVNTSDAMAVGDAIELHYGAALESLEFARRIMALRPYGSVDLHLSPNLVVEYRYATAEPNTRGAKGFDSAPADLSEAGPRMSLSNGAPDVERAQHQELSVSRRFGSKTNVQIACYLDRVHNLVLTGAGDPSSYSDDVLSDVYSGTFSYAYSGNLSTTGTRVVVERQIVQNLSAIVNYSTGGAVEAETAPGTWQNLAQSLAVTRQHAVGTKVVGYVPVSGTRWIASYQWTSGNALSLVDAFNASPGQTDPYLSVFIRQPIPGTSFIPGKIDALLDLRNLLAQGYLPVAGQDGRTVYMVQSARSLRGGLSFTF
jgi:hypothetical protein